MKFYRPAYLAGHIEPGETPLEAMRREAKEEADLDVADWVEIGIVAGQSNPEDRIFMFATRTDLSRARTMTDEPVQVFTWKQVEQLPLALAAQEIMGRVREAAGAALIVRRVARPGKP